MFRLLLMVAEMLALFWYVVFNMRRRDVFRVPSTCHGYMETGTHVHLKQTGGEHVDDGDSGIRLLFSNTGPVVLTAPDSSVRVCM